MLGKHKINSCNKLAAVTKTLFGVCTYFILIRVTLSLMIKGFNNINRLQSYSFYFNYKCFLQKFSFKGIEDGISHIIIFAEELKVRCSLAKT